MALLTPWGSTVTFEVSSVGPDDPPAWVDLSDYLRPARGEIRGERARQTELDAAEPGRLGLVLDNGDLPERYPGDPWAPAGRFTSGNPTAPTYPWWKQARRCRLRETIAGRTFDLYDGHIEIPQTNVYMQPVDTSQPADMLELVAAIDRLGRLQNARTFISNLGAQVLEDATNLSLYWSLTETGGTFDTATNGPNPLLVTPVHSASAVASPALFAPAGGGPVAADDAPVVSFTPVMVSNGSFFVTSTGIELFSNFNGGAGIAVPSNATITMACWVEPSADSPDAIWIPVEIGFGTGLAGGGLRIRRTNSTESPAGVWKAFFADIITAAWSAEAFGTHGATKPTMLAVRVNLADNTMSLIVDDATYPATVTGTLPTSGTLLNMRVGRDFTGAIGHVQVHSGPAASDVNLPAQLAVGRYGLEHQTTGQRINTILDYAGVPAGMRDIDPGVAVMQRALLADTSPGEQLENARATERGRLYVACDGRVTFRDRRASYNI